jgi:hypothetical protein
VDEELFDERLESVEEAGAVLRGEREAARSARYDDASTAPGEGRMRPDDSSSGEG